MTQLFCQVITGQQARKAWLGIYLNCITPVRFSVGGADKGTTEYRGSMSDQLTIFSREAFVMVCIERSYNPFTTTNIYFIRAAYNSYFSNYLYTFNFDYLPSDLQHTIGSQHIIILFVPVCKTLLYLFSATLFSSFF